MENAASTTLVVKLSFDGTLRRITIPKVAEPSFAALQQRARELFDLQESAQVSLAYTDRDGDIVTMVDNADLKDAIVLQELNPLRVAVKVKKATASIKDSINAIKEKSYKEKTKRATAPLVLAPKESAPAKEEAKLAGETSESAKIEESPKEDTLRKEETFVKEDAPKAEDSPAKEETPKKDETKPEVPPTEELKRIQKEVKERLEAVLKGAAGDMEGLMASFAPFLQVAPAKLAEVMHLAMKSGLHASFEPQFEMNHPAPAPAAEPARAEAEATPAGGSQKEEASPESSAAKEDAEDEMASNIFHTGVQCDICGANPIVGPRYKSIVRINYDLCKACYAKEGVEGEYNKIDRPLFRPRMHPFWGHGSGGPMPPRMGMRAAGSMGPQGPCFGGRPFYQGRVGGCGRFADRSTTTGEGKPDRMDARFVKDVTVFDGTELAPGTPFTKIWRLRNSGTLPWPQHSQLVHVGGDHMGSSQAATVELPEAGLAPGEETDVSVDLVAPQNTGRYISHWRMLAPGGPKFGHRVWALVHVVPAGEPSPQVAESVAAAASACSSSEAMQQPAEEVTSQVELAAIDKEVATDDTVKEVPVNFIDLAKEEPVAPTAAPIEEAEVPVIAEPAAPESPKTEVTSVGGFSLVDRVPANYSSSSSASDAVVEEQLDTSFVMSALPSAPKDDVTGEAAAPPMEHSALNAANMSQMLEQLESKMLEQLESMGFTDTQLNESLLQRNDMQLQRTIDELVGANEWDHMMVELEEMGFYDKDVNRRLMFKNKGSMTRVVKELVENLKRSEQD